MSFAGSCQPTAHRLEESNGSGEREGWFIHGAKLYLWPQMIKASGKQVRTVHLEGHPWRVIKGSYKAC